MMIAGEQFSNAYTAVYPEFAGQLPGHNLDWLLTFRQAGLQVFNQHGFPGIREEEWRFTNLSALNKSVFQPIDTGFADAEALQAYRLRDAWSVVLVNGRFSEPLSDLAGLPDAVTLRSMRQALQDNPELVKSLLGKAVGNGEHSLIAFNSAWFNDGVFVEIAAGYRLAKPIQIIHVANGENSLAASRNLFLLHESATAEIVETYAGTGGNYFTVAVNEGFLGDSAALTLHKVQLETENAMHFGGTYLRQADNSHLMHHNFAFGGLLARSDIHSDLGTASECLLHGLYLGGKRQHIDNHTRINHLQPEAVSREFYKGVLDQRARGVFQGRVIVAENAQKTDSEMNNRNLLLSADAEIDTKPQLEIYADDVKCSHGVTVGQLEEKSVFYLQSRGLDETAARNILTFAFANEMVDKIENEELKAMLFQCLLARFPAISL